MAYASFHRTNYAGRFGLSTDKKVTDPNLLNEAEEGRNQLKRVRSCLDAGRECPMSDSIVGKTVKSGKYLVKEKVGEGGFGAVFKVEDNTDHKLYAMKTEVNSEAVLVLKMEVFVLQAVRELPSGGRHFCELIDHGRRTHFNYVIMTLVGKHLGQVMRMLPGRRFSLGTVLGVAHQCLEAVEDLHSVGVLHRDLKPANFAIGTRESKQTHTIFMLDFGLARRFRDDKGEIRTPRSKAGFRGTARYASIATHLGSELSRKDDLENWFYQTLEMIVIHLPWHDVCKKPAIGNMKKRLVEKFPADVPLGFLAILKYIHALHYVSEPDYSFIHRTLVSIRKERKIPDDEPLDWEMTKKAATLPLFRMSHK